MGLEYGVFGTEYGFLEIVFGIIFVIVIGSFIVSAIKGVGTWNKNNHSPQLMVSAKVVTKRADTSYSSHPNAGDTTGAHGYSTFVDTWYYATFEVESGDRMEFSVTGSEYGMLAEGDTGRLTFRGTRYLGFEHN